MSQNPQERCIIIANSLLRGMILMKMALRKIGKGGEDEVKSRTSYGFLGVL
jgi:hypothetical protein